MEIYCIKIDGKKYKQYKTFEDAFIDFEKKINESQNFEKKINESQDFKKKINEIHNLEIKIILEEYCEYGYLDNCCKIDVLCEYKDFIIKKYL
jgi:hypothetical protein